MGVADFLNAAGNGCCQMALVFADIAEAKMITAAKYFSHTMGIIICQQGMQLTEQEMFGHFVSEAVGEQNASISVPRKFSYFCYLIGMPAWCELSSAVVINSPLLVTSYRRRQETLVLYSAVFLDEAYIKVKTPNL